MFKVQIDMKELNYDNIVDKLIEQQKNQKENRKIPSFINLSLDKKLPQNMKNEFIAKALIGEKKKAIHIFETKAQNYGFRVKIKDMHAKCVKEAGE